MKSTWLRIVKLDRLWLLPCIATAFACNGAAVDEDIDTAEAPVGSMPLTCDPATLPAPQDELCRATRLKEGRRLFDKETFGGNGRRCETCHSKNDGTIDPAEVQARLAADPNDPLFVQDGLDDFTSGTSRIEAHATILITRTLPQGVLLADDPSATEVVVARGVPTTVNTPALDPLLMYDLRDPNLEAQALGAIHAHYENTEEPTSLELELIAEFESTDSRFFSNHDLEDFAAGGPAPQLPAGTTDSEVRGREFFVDAPFVPGSNKGVCALCHSGPMLDTTNVFSPPVFDGQIPPGIRAFDTRVSQENKLNLPVRTYLISDLCGTTIPFASPDPGLLLTDPWTVPFIAQFLPPKFLCLLHPIVFVDNFKIPTLFGVKNTAPYFHDNSAKSLEEVLDHYEFLFANPPFPLLGTISLSQQDRADILAFMNLL